MKTRTAGLISSLVVGFLLNPGARAQAPAPPDGVEVLARGPVHEAFAEPVVRGPRPTPVVPKAPPPPIQELPPDQKPAGDNVQWIPGYWAWDADRGDYLWVSGTWRIVPPDRQWLPGHWNQANGGWQWVAGFWQPRNQQAVQLLPQPPDPVAEAVAPAPAQDQVFVPGTWVFRDTRYLWRPGFWVGNRPGWVWIPAHYVWTPAGYVFVEGYWDFPLANRGLLFAPVSLARQLLRPGWVYSPTYVLDYDFLTGALFIRLATNHYYFGDYFDPRYLALGYTPWVDFRMSRVLYDPLYSHYAWSNRADPTVVQNLQQQYLARREGRVPRPPQTLAQQQTLVKNSTSTTVARTMPLVSLAGARTKLKLQAVTSTQAAEERKAIQQFRDLSRERARAVAQVAAENPSAGTARTGKAVQLDLNVVNPASRATSAAKVVQPPPLPPPLIHAVAKPVTPEVKTGEHHPVVITEPKPMRPLDAPVIVKPEKPVIPRLPEKPVVESRPSPKPPPKPEPKPMSSKSSDKDKKPN